MTIARDVGQLLWLGFHGTRPPDELTRSIAAGEVGCVVLFKRNLVVSVAGGGEASAAIAQEVIDIDAVVDLDRALHASAPAGEPVLIAIDQEGGTVQRVRAPATQWPPMLTLDGVAPPEDVVLAERIGNAIGRELAAVGVDVDFAPVLDIHTNPANPVIGERAFGRDAGAVTRRALAFARGMQATGVLPCGKHFPGHGDTAVDSHHALPRVDHDRARLDAVELAPFAAAAKAELPMLMTAHVVFSALDKDLPATLSPTMIGGVLRNELDYRGVVVSDDLDMKAIVDHWGVADAAIRAVRAGCDALLLCRIEEHQRQARAALIAEAERDATFRARIGEAAERVRALGRQHALLSAAAEPTSRDTIGAPAHRALADRLTGRA